MELEKDQNAYIEQHIDTSIIAGFPPDFFQKAYDRKSKFFVQITQNRIFLREPNGRIISWTPVKRILN